MVHIHFLLEYHNAITRYNLTNLYLTWPFDISHRVRSYRTYWRRIQTSRTVHLPVLDQTLAHPCAGADGEHQAVCRRETVHWSSSRSVRGYQDRSVLRRGVQQTGHCAFRSQVCRWLLCWHWEGEPDQTSYFTCIKCSVLYAYVISEVYCSYGLTWSDFILAGPQPFLLSSYLHPSFYNMRLSFHWTISFYHHPSLPVSSALHYPANLSPQAWLTRSYFSSSRPFSPILFSFVPLFFILILTLILLLTLIPTLLTLYSQLSLT